MDYGLCGEDNSHRGEGDEEEGRISEEASPIDGDPAAAKAKSYDAEHD